MAIYAVAAWVYMLAFPRGLPLPYLDQSWQAIVSLACAGHWAFGRQIMLNYGPWSPLSVGFYYAPLFTATYLFQIVSRVVLIALICRVSRPLPPVERALFLVANLLTGMLEWETMQMLAVVYAGWLTSEDRTRTGRVIGGAGVVLAAAGALMKTFYLVFGVGVFGCVLARHVLRGHGKRAAWFAGLAPLGGFVLCFGVDWLLAGQSLADLPAYLRGAFALMDGHSRAMGLDADPQVFLLCLVMMCWIGAMGVALLLRGERGQRVAMLPLAALFGGSAFMAWKQGFSRPDAYHMTELLWFIAVLVVALPLFFDRRALRPVWHFAAIGGVWTMAVWATGLARPQVGPFLVHELQTRPLRNLHVLFQPAAECARLDAKMQQLRLDCALPQTRAAVGQARIDLFGIAQDLILNNDLNYAPTPLLQGFLAYTPSLVQLNEQAYQPGRAPEFVLFQGDSIDNRWPALDGAWQLREILWNYRPLLTEASLALLQRKPEAECVSPRPILRQQGELPLDARLPLPADGSDWCELEVQRTLLGGLINFFYHEPALVMEATVADGRSRTFTLPPVMAQSGFLLRNGIVTKANVLALMNNGVVRDPVTSIQLGGNRLLRWAIGTKVTYRLYHLDPPKPATGSFRL